MPTVKVLGVQPQEPRRALALALKVAIAGVEALGVSPDGVSVMFTETVSFDADPPAWIELWMLEREGRSEDVLAATKNAAHAAARAVLKRSDPNSVKVTVLPPTPLWAQAGRA